jgi:hypothetical protein
MNQYRVLFSIICEIHPWCPFLTSFPKEIEAILDNPAFFVRMVLDILERGCLSLCA